MYYILFNQSLLLVLWLGSNFSPSITGLIVAKSFPQFCINTSEYPRPGTLIDYGEIVPDNMSEITLRNRYIAAHL